LNLATVIRKLKKGNHNSFKELVYTHTPKLMTVARIYTLNSEDAKDVLQDAFISIYQHVAKFKGEDEKAFVGWMKKIVRNAAISKYRKMSYKKEDYCLEQISESSVEPIVLANFDKQELMDAIFSLPLKYKQIIGLYAIEGYSHKEIANILNIKEGTSRSTFSRAKVMLLKSINPKQLATS